MNMKEIRLKLLSELMKNSKVSDRELSKRLRVSQPTVSRIRARLEKEGYIKEYTMVPDFAKLGFEIMAVNFLTLKRPLSDEEIAKIRKFGNELLKKAPYAVLLAAEGMGCGADRILITFHESYSAYSEFVKIVKQNTAMELSSFDSFMISLSASHFQPLSFSRIADYILKMEKKPL